MKTISEFALHKIAINDDALMALLATPILAASFAGKASSVFTDPPERTYETLQQDLLKTQLRSVLEAKAKERKLKKLEDVVNDKKRSIRI